MVLIMSMLPDRVPVCLRAMRVSAIVVLGLPLSISGMALAFVDHTSDFVRYARVDRADGTYREMLVDEATITALRAGTALTDGATILMESYSRPGEISTIFAKRRDGGRWLYGSFARGEPMPAFRPRPQCSGCHRAADATDGTFTLPMLQRFTMTGTLQRARCEQFGRTPCHGSIYQGQ
jgi:hypothetical protein